MDSLNIIEKYKNMVINEFKDMSLILYGSTVYGVETSDLDICFFSNKEISNDRLEKLKYLTRLFHIKNNLAIDEEVPYDNKLIYTKNMIMQTFKEPPFPYVENKYVINPISKTKEYLSSLEMSKRLLLNILTVRHNVLFGNADKIKKYSDEAWEIIIKIVLSYSEKKEVSISELINYLYEDPYTHAKGELYLGYKTNLKEKMYYLENCVNENIRRLEEKNIVTKTLKKKYVFDESWLKK